MHNGCAEQEHPGDVKHGKDAQPIASARLLVNVVADAFMFGFFDGMPCPHFFEAWVHAFSGFWIGQHLMRQNGGEVLDGAGNRQTTLRWHVLTHELFLFALKVFYFGRRVAHRIQVFTEFVVLVPVNGFLLDEAFHL